jgi:predicted TIM-barrel fold metal-dependent hydrolase
VAVRLTGPATPGPGAGAPLELGDVRLVDHHCHGVVTTDLDRPAFERLLHEGGRLAPPGTSHFDSPLGLAVRRWCAPVLDLDPGAPPDAYLDRRAALGAAAVNRRLLSAAGFAALLVDTGHGPPSGTTLAELAASAGAPVHEVVRIERVAEEVLAELDTPAGFVDAFERRLRARAATAVGLKSVAAYRGGFDLVASPDRPDVVAAVERTLSRPEVRLDDPVLVRHGLDVAGDVAGELGLPVQFHTGFGDTDLQLDRADPARLTPVLRQYGARGATVVLLHCYPYHRQAGYLAAVFPHVHFDVGLALPYVGAGSTGLLAEALELAPFRAQLFSSDAFGLAEIYLVAARLFRRGLQAVLAGWVEAGDCTVDDADRIVRAIAAGNARRIYDLATRR